MSLMGIAGYPKNKIVMDNETGRKKSAYKIQKYHLNVVKIKSRSIHNRVSNKQQIMAKWLNESE